MFGLDVSVSSESMQISRETYCNQWRYVWYDWVSSAGTSAPILSVISPKQGHCARTGVDHEQSVVPDVGMERSNIHRRWFTCLLGEEHHAGLDWDNLTLDTCALVGVLWRRLRERSAKVERRVQARNDVRDDIHLMYALHLEDITGQLRK